MTREDYFAGDHVCVDCHEWFEHLEAQGREIGSVSGSERWREARTFFITVALLILASIMTMCTMGDGFAR
jgi:hypothetical protein